MNVCTCSIASTHNTCVYVYKSWKRGYLCVRVLIIELVDQNLDKIYLFNFDRIAFLTRNMTTPLWESFTAAIFVFTTATLAVNVGILPLMEQNVVNQWPLMGFSTCRMVQHKISFVIAILKVTVIRFPKVTSELDSGLEIVQVMAMQMLALAGTQCLVLWLKKFLHLKLNSLTLLLAVFLDVHVFALNRFYLTLDFRFSIFAIVSII